MPKKIVIVTVIVVVVIFLALAGYYFFVLDQKKTPLGTPAPDSKNAPFQNSIPLTDDSTESKIGAFEGIVTNEGTHLKCTFISGTHGGSLYANGTKAILSYQNFSDKKNYTVLIDGPDAYIWQRGDTKGFKTTKQSIFSRGPNYLVFPLGGLDPAGQFDFSCEEREFSDTVFDLPKDVTFREFGS